MHNPNFRTDFYMSKLTARDLNYISKIASQSLYRADEDGTPEPELYRYLFDHAVNEMRRRGDCAEGVIREPEPLPFPNWWGNRLATAMLQANAISYLNLTAGCAALADWLASVLTCQAAEYIERAEMRIQQNA